TARARVRRVVLDGAVRTGRSGSVGANASARLLSTLEGQLAPDGGDALLGAVAGFYDAWSAVADAPADRGPRDALLAAAGTLTSAFNAADGRLGAFAEAAQTELGTTVDRVNGLMAEIAELNGALRSSDRDGVPDLNAQDRRDAVLDELSGLLTIQARPEADGTVSVRFGGLTGVQGTESLPLRLVGPPDASPPEVRAEGVSRPLDLSSTEGGVLGAQLGLVRDALPAAQQALDTLAADIVAGVNGLHQTGTGLDGSTGLDLFEPTGTTAGSIRLSPTFPGPDALAASGAAGQTGDGSVAAQLAGLGEDAYAAMTDVLAGVGSQTRGALAAADANAAYAEYTSALRDGLTKVSLDEEMTDLIRYQQAYAASARVLETADSLFDTLLAI
ncbi:MAG: flagellar hook-associated protein FlgK, partial [Bacteroidota bacterium]